MAVGGTITLLGCIVLAEFVAGDGLVTKNETRSDRIYGPLSLTQPDRLGYLLVIPLTISAGTDQKTCVSLHNFNYAIESSVRVKVRLHNTKDTKNYDAHETVFGNGTTEKCFDLTVPPLKGKDMKLAVITATLEEFGSENTLIYGVEAQKELIIHPPALSVYINTDKQVYKPGQDVLFRVLQLNGIYPTNEMVTKITIEDPKQRKLMVYNDMEPNLGLVSDHFQLVSEPTLGEWHIKVELAGQKFQTKFKVEEYVLPKYEVTIQVPNFLHVESEEFDIKVCAKYTYGKPVRGRAHISISMVNPYWNYGNNRPTQNEQSETDETGCTVVKGSPEIMQFRNREYQYHNQKLKVVAKVTEAETGVIISGENTECSLTLSPYTPYIENSVRNFKPGLPWSSMVYYKDVDENPLPGKLMTVELVKSANNESYSGKDQFNMTTDADGGFKLNFPTSPHVSTYDINVWDPAFPPRWYSWNANERDAKLSISREVATTQLTRWSSPSHSYLSIDAASKDAKLDCRETYTFTGQVIIPRETESDINEPMIFCKVTSGASIVYEGIARVISFSDCLSSETEDVEAMGACRFSWEITANIDQRWMPKAKVLVYFVRADKEVVADDTSVDVPGCFSNEADLEFESEVVRPGEEVGLTLTAAPHSLCALSIVDKSVHLLGGDNSMTSDKITKELEKANHLDIDYVVEEGCFAYNNFEYRYKKGENDILIDTWRRYSQRWARSAERTKRSTREKRRSVPYPFIYGTEDSSTSFKNLRLLYVTNLKIHLLDCDNIFHRPIAYEMSIDDSSSGPEIALSRSLPGGGEEAIEVRNYFPETWKWELMETGEDGVVKLENEEMPDTITEWVAHSYCISNEAGIGVSKPAMVKGFKPVFLSMTLPYSVIRGEQVTIKSTLFNYLSKDTCLEMVISLDQSEDFRITGDGEAIFTRCLCGGDAVTLNIGIEPLSLGEIKLTMKAWSKDGHICGKDVKSVQVATDGVERTLLVESEGEEVETTHTDFVCMPNQTEDALLTLYVERPIYIPLDIYVGSEKVLVNVLGSVIGPVLDNLDHLIKVPYGCGEQNMVTMVPNIVVLKYLIATQNITPTLRKRIVSNILQGYQRQLNYQRKDGSFSAFGDSDSSGSTWLTAFVMSSFTEAKEFIFVDDEIILKARVFIDENRKENGCVKKVGLVHNKRMMGGIDGGNSLDAYVSLANFKSGLLDREEESTGDVAGCDGSIAIKTYTRALLFYKNTLQGKFDSARMLWRDLKSSALYDGRSFEKSNKIFWTDEEEEEEEYEAWWWDRKPSDAVEVTGYVLMGFLEMEKAFPDDFDIEAAYPMVNYLTSQRNAYGGWSSTQNTIIGLTALAKYASRTFVSDTAMKIVVNQNGEAVLPHIDIDEDNALVVQQKLIAPAPEVIKYEASGKGCALIQTVVKYNIPRVEPSPSFTISTHVRGLEKGCEAPGTRLLVVCATYQGTHKQPVSNMAVIEVKMVTGYHAVKESLQTMTKKNEHNGLKRFEIDGKKVTFYFRAIGSQLKCAAFEVAFDEEIKNVQPGMARVFDYYDPEKSASTFYDMSCGDESYNPETHEHDCLKWNTNGHCEKHCVVPRGYQGYCQVSIEVQGRNHDICKRYGDRSCGENGRCILTSNYYRCACNEGFRDRWRWCQREPLQIWSKPECDDANVCPMPARGVKEGNETNYYCSDGYDLMGSGNTSYCVDIDECEEECTEDTLECSNTDGSYQCRCREGYAPFIDIDEGIEELTNCELLEIVEPELPEPPVLLRPEPPLLLDFPDLPPPPIEIEIRNRPAKTAEVQLHAHQCPMCLKKFPKSAEFRNVFCPKVNVYVVTNTSSTETMMFRPIVQEGKSVYGDRINDVRIDMPSYCVCDNLLGKKSMMFTLESITTNDEGSTITIDALTTVTSKRAWKKVQRLSCEEPSPEPEPKPIPEDDESMVIPELESVDEAEVRESDEIPKI